MKFLLFVITFFTFCDLTASAQNEEQAKEKEKPAEIKKESATAPAADSPKIIHIFVALCDNEHQGIVPVPEKIGKGDDPANNLYWGCDDGVKGCFDKAKNWKLSHVAENVSEVVLERRIYRHAGGKFILIADAYRGDKIKNCITDCVNALAGRSAATEFKWKDRKTEEEFAALTASGAALIVYIGHNGLMEFELDSEPEHADQIQRDSILLGCLTRSYFDGIVKKAGARDVMMTTSLMCPAAYIVRDALEGWMIGEPPDKIRARGAAAYAREQKCSLKAASNILEAPLK